MSYKASRLNSPPGLGPGAEDLIQQTQRELDRISETFQLLPHVQLKELHNAPEKPRTGMIVLADGTNWNPGSGAGFYGYYGGSWSKLG